MADMTQLQTSYCKCAASDVAHSGNAAPDYDIEAPRFDHHGRTWVLWSHTAFMRQAVAYATAIATFGGATHAAKCEMRDLCRAASHQQMGELAEDAEPLDSVGISRNI